MRKATKTIISFAVILIAGLNFIVPAFAQDPFTAIAVGGLTGASGAGLFSSMAAASGVNIGWGSGGSDPVDAMWNVLNPDHVYFSGEKHESTGQGEDLYDYIDVDIGDWLQAQTDFISEFCSEYQVTDNSSGQTQTISSLDGIPVGSVLFTFTSPYVSGTTYQGPGKFRLSIMPNGSNHSWALYYDNYTCQVFNNIDSMSNFVITLGSYDSNTGKFNIGYTYYWRGSPGYSGSTTTDTQPETVGTLTWNSGTVDENVFDDYGAARVKIPYGNLTTGWGVPDFLDVLDTLWSNGQQSQIQIEDRDNPPVPPQPIPDTPLGEVPFDDWVDLWGQGIWSQLENQSDALDFIGSAGEDAVEELESIDTSIQDLGETAESIDTNIGVGNGILGGIRSLAQSAVNYLEGIAEHVGELVEEIVEGTETLIAGILNQIPPAFSVIFGPIKQASSIWHYVVEWIQSIGAPFQFIWSMASGTSYYVILPVYASLAAAVVLAFFKRFGR